MTRQRALVQRPGRKIHFATLTPGDTTWIGVGCDREVPVFGATVTGRDDWTTWLTAAQTDTGSMCIHCRTPLLVAALALHEVEDIRASVAHAEQLEQEVVSLRSEVRTLRAEVTSWAVAGLDEIRHGFALKFGRAAR
jgi:hypothetical protein